MRFGFGARHAISESLQVALAMEVNISRVPPVDARLSLIPVEPIASMKFSLTRRPALPPAPLVPAPTTGRIEGVVATQSDEPIAGATVTLSGRKFVTRENGRFHFVGLKPGPVTIMISASGHIVAPLRADVAAGRVIRIPIVAVEQGTPGQIRLLVRTLGGKGIAGTATVSPGDHKVSTNALGEAEIELTPGAYQVFVEAPDHSSQMRTVTVDPYGVTILNLDLMSERIEEAK
jgi:hypothetical protein